jgi:hypothetical protein
MNKRHALAIAAIVVTCGPGAFLAVGPSGLHRNSVQERPVWAEVRWPFPLDQWGQGRAFQCKASDCGSEINLYLRAKIGFCNCAIGVSDDQELDRVGDVDLIDGTSAALRPGRPVVVHGMRGRIRGYAIDDRSAFAKSALSIAVNDRCDVIVATSIIDGDQPDEQESAVLDFLNSDLVLRWAETTLGL